MPGDLIQCARCGKLHSLPERSPKRLRIDPPGTLTCPQCRGIHYHDPPLSEIHQHPTPKTTPNRVNL